MAAVSLQMCKSSVSLNSLGVAAVYVWDLRTQRCLQRYQDEGCLNGTSLACSPDGSLFATGTMVAELLSVLCGKICTISIVTFFVLCK